MGRFPLQQKVVPCTDFVTKMSTKTRGKKIWSSSPKSIARDINVFYTCDAAAIKGDPMNTVFTW